jgi:hypothetical protein
MKDDITEALEAMIDAHGLLHVLTGLSLVCSEKADHLRDNWQDIDGDYCWRKASKAIEVTANKVSHLSI